MADPRVDKLADLLVNYSIAVQPGQKIAIQGTSLAEPLIRSVYSEVLKAGGHPLVLATLPGLDEIFYRHASDDQLEHVSSSLQARGRYLRRTHRHAGLREHQGAQQRPAREDGAKPTRDGRGHADVHAPSRGQGAALGRNALPHERDGPGRGDGPRGIRGLRLQRLSPDLADPIGYWKKFSKWQQGLVEWLKGKKEVHVIGPDTDLRLSIAGRPFINCDGRANMPDGEVFTSPVEGSVEGHVRYTYPAVYRGREVTNVRLKLEKGRVVEAKADKGQDFLLRTLDVDEGARVPGEFAIGTNRGVTRFMRQTLFDEKIAGTFHMALGASIPESGGHQSLRGALGHGLRPKARRRDPGRRRAPPQERGVRRQVLSLG
jgi:aminopeptidase